ncbi:competence protein ComK [Psychrobacillus sp. FSL H8-0483]|uniref:competence protein ComK n=1 Tax=Psychrobacillus sp. FSL H8-0483 TaxID=2921389 RepID=UPI00315A591D
MINCDSKLIGKRTLMIESSFLDGYQSKITTTHGIYFSGKTVIYLLDKACIRYASTLEGRMEAIKKMMNYLNKTPLIIHPCEIGAFPTMSYKKLECVWIFNHHFEVEELSKGISRLTFFDGTCVTVNASKHVLLKQQQRLLTTISTYNLIHREKDLYIGNDFRGK